MLKQWSSRLETALILVTLTVLLGIASPHFLSADNLLNVGQQSAINALLGIGLTFVILSGGIDLSVGSILALSGLVSADMLVAGHGTVVAILSGIAVGLACGLVNGAVTTLGRIPPFITTLGMMLVARSLAKIYSDSRPISGLPDEFRALAGDVGGVPSLLIFMAAFYLVAHLVLTRTKLGRYAYAIGGNEQAAWLSGVPVGKYKVAIYALSGGMAGVSGVLLTARLNAASPLAGEMYELYAIAAAVIGGVSLMGGEGRVMGTLIGALVMGVLRNGLNLLNVPSALEGVVVGSVLVTAVTVDRLRHRGSGGPARPRHSPKRRATLWATAGTCALALAFTQRVQVQAEAKADLTVALVPKSLSSPFFSKLAEAAQSEADRLGVRLLTLAPERQTDVESQHQIVENLIEQKVDALMLAPSGSKEMVPAIRKANEAGIPVFILDTRVDAEAAAAAGAEHQMYIGSDNFHGGYILGKFIARELGGHGELAILEGIAGHETGEARKRGFLKAVAEHPGLRVVASQTANWERERGYTVAQNMLQANSRLRAIFAVNDQMALGALEAVAAARRSDDILLVGYDADPDALVSIREGKLAATVAQFPDEMGKLGITHAVDLLRSGTVPPRELPTRVELITPAAMRAQGDES